MAADSLNPMPLSPEPARPSEQLEGARPSAPLSSGLAASSRPGVTDTDMPCEGTGEPVARVEPGRADTGMPCEGAEGLAASSRPGVTCPGSPRKGNEGLAARDEPSVTDLDMLYKETDELYDRLARGCGLSESAYWILYAIQVAGGEDVTQRDIADRLSCPKQTINSAVRTLEARGLVSLDFAPNNRRSKVISLTREGHAFAEERIVPAMEVEARAFARLEPGERAEFIRLATKYARAVLEEMTEEEVGKHD